VTEARFHNIFAKGIVVCELRAKAAIHTNTLFPGDTFGKYFSKKLPAVIELFLD